eukprot:581331-Pelagomonas_calceolata.AAC.6
MSWQHAVRDTRGTGNWWHVPLLLPHCCSGVWTCTVVRSHSHAHCTLELVMSMDMVAIRADCLRDSGKQSPQTR